MSFVHILQRCPTYTPKIFESLRNDPDRILLLTHSGGVPVEPAVRAHVQEPAGARPERSRRGPRARRRGGDRLAIGLLYRNPDAPRYDQYTVRGLGMSREQKVAAIERELDRFAI